MPGKPVDGRLKVLNLCRFVDQRLATEIVWKSVFSKHWFDAFVKKKCVLICFGKSHIRISLNIELKSSWTLYE